MLGRKDYTQKELDDAKASVDAEFEAYQKLAKAGAADKKVAGALAAFEPLFCNNMVLALDRPFVHRLRVGTGKDSNALNEVELLVDSLINNGGVLRGNNVIKYVPEQTVLKLDIGDRIQVTAEQFDRLARAFFEEIERKFR